MGTALAYCLQARHPAGVRFPGVLQGAGKYNQPREGQENPTSQHAGGPSAQIPSPRRLVRVDAGQMHRGVQGSVEVAKGATPQYPYGEGKSRFEPWQRNEASRRLSDRVVDVQPRLHILAGHRVPGKPPVKV